jgi:hypothetical protein
VTGLINTKVRGSTGVPEQGALSVSSRDKTDISTQTMNENRVQTPTSERTQPENPEIVSTANQSQRSVDSQSIPSAHPVREVQATQSAFVEKYEMGSGKDKINVRIFKEPPVEPAMLETQKDINVKQTNGDTRVFILIKRGTT